MSIVLTKAALALKNTDNNFQFVKFESHKPKKKDVTKIEKEDLNTVDSQHSRKDNVDLKRIRHEIVKFGMSGFDSTKKEEAKIALAVSLGAKPPKREYINYKELMKKRKEEKERAKEQKQQMISKSVMHSGGIKKKKKTNNDVGHFLSEYGKVQKKDLKKDDSNHKKKKKKKLI